MKKISIVYNQPLTQIQGINYVNNSFVMGGKYFMKQGMMLDKIYAPDCVFDCTMHDHLDLIGANCNTVSYRRERKIRKFLRVLLSSRYLLGASIKMYLNRTYTAKKAVRRMKKLNDESDYLIFQDFNSVRQYYKLFGKRGNVKTVLILHCSNHPLEQVMPAFPGYYRYKCLKRHSIKRCEEAMQMVDKVIYLSEHAVNASILDNTKKTYIFNGVDDLENIKIGQPSVPLQLACVGSVTIRKGQLNLVEALSLLEKDTLNKLHLTIVGGGDEFEICKQLVKDKNLDDYVTITGPRNDVADILKGMDVFLLPSQSEGMPMSIIEAMRQGLYIMASETGGIPEMIGDGYGELITRDYQQLAASIKHIVNDGVVTKDVKEKSRERFLKDFTLKTMIGRYVDVLKNL